MRVLIAADESDHGVAVAQTALALFGATAEYLMVSVAPVGPPVGLSSGWGVATPMMVPVTVIGSAGGASTTELEQLAHRAGLHAAEVSARSPLDGVEPIGDVGDPTDCILAAAHEHQVDVIVIGYHDRSWFSRLLAPSVSRTVLRESDLPVLVVR